jgi:hypothetical protein
MRCVRVWSLSLLLVACHEDAVEPADMGFEPLCGEVGAVELLALADDEEVGWVERVDDDDLLVLVGHVEDFIHHEARTWQRSVVVDECAKTVTELPAGSSSLERWGDVLVACIDDDLFQLESYDDPSPELLAQRGCATQSLGELWLTTESAPGSAIGRLLALEVVGSTIEVRELVDGVFGHVTAPRFPAVVDGRVFVQTADSSVRSVDPWTGELALELESAQPDRWVVSADMIVYRAPALDPELPAPVLLRDRRTGVETTLGVEVPTSWSSVWWNEDVLTVRPSGSPDEARWFRLDPLRELVPPAGMIIEKVRADGLMWLSTVDVAGTLTVLRGREGEAPAPVFLCEDCYLPSYAWRTDYLDVLVETDAPEQHELWRLDDPEAPARMLAGGVGRSYHMLDDERVLSVRPDGALQKGPLQLFDGSDEPVTLVSRVNRSANVLTSSYDVPDEVIYESAQHGGAHALFRARLSP